MHDEIKKIGFIINPETLHYKKFDKEYVNSILVRNGFETFFYYTERPLHEVELTNKALAEGCNAFVVVGGSGTLHHVLQQVVFEDVFLCLFPTGSGNSLAKHIGIKADNNFLIETILEGVVEEIDIGCLTLNEDKDIYFSGYSCLGGSAWYANRHGNAPIKNRILFILNSARILFRKEKPFFNVRFNHIDLTLNFHEFFVGIVSTYGGKLADRNYASVKNNQFRIQMWRTVRKWRYLSFLFKYSLNLDDDFSDVYETYSAEEIIINCDEEQDFHADFEPYKVQGELIYRCLPKKLNLLIPKYVVVV